jgi:hypothetical protein
MSIVALVALAVSLERLPPDSVPRKARPIVKELIRSIWTMVEAHGSQHAA